MAFPITLWGSYWGFPLPGPFGVPHYPFPFGSPMGSLLPGSSWSCHITESLWGPSSSCPFRVSQDQRPFGVHITGLPVETPTSPLTNPSRVLVGVPLGSLSGSSLQDHSILESLWSFPVTFGYENPHMGIRDHWAPSPPSYPCVFFGGAEHRQQSCVWSKAPTPNPNPPRST